MQHKLARILKFTIKEFSDVDVDFIRDRCIEGTDMDGSSQAAQLTNNAKLITGMNSESIIVGEGEYQHDLVFCAMISNGDKVSNKYIYYIHATIDRLKESE